MKTSEKIIGVKALRENLEKYISGAGKGYSYLVVRRSKPVFRVVPVDEWGDEGRWETVVDFTKIRKGGVPAGEVLKQLRAMKKKK